MKTNILLPALLNESTATIAREVLTALLLQQAYAIVIYSDDNSSCQYTTVDGRHCAAGLALPDIVQPNNGTSINEVAINLGWATSKDRKDHPGLTMLQELQVLHDTAARAAKGATPATRAEMCTQLLDACRNIHEQNRPLGDTVYSVIEQVLLELA